MDRITEYIESGILEMYVLGIAGDEEARQVEHMAASHPEIQKEIDDIRQTLETAAVFKAIKPEPTIKPFLLATIDYTERLSNGETPSFPPELNSDSKIENYKEWTDRKDMSAPPDFDQFHAKIIGYTPKAITAIIWIRNMAPPETHDNELEKFLILEGSCDITIGNTIYSLVPGNYLSIPLHVSHNVRVTSKTPCKAILQRIAA